MKVRREEKKNGFRYQTEYVSMSLLQSRRKPVEVYPEKEALHTRGKHSRGCLRIELRIPNSWKYVKLSVPSNLSNMMH